MSRTTIQNNKYKKLKNEEHEAKDRARHMVIEQTFNNVLKPDTVYNMGYRGVYEN